MTKKKKNREDVLRRMKIIEGHLQKVRQMMEEDRYCIDVLQQTAAVKSAISKVEELLLEGHLKSCVISHIKENREEKAITEILQVFKRFNNK